MGSLMLRLLLISATLTIQAEGACKLCPDGSSLLSPKNDLPFFEEQLGYVPTCELLEAFLPEDDALCSISQELLPDYCGCGGATVETGCSLCIGGEVVPSPEKELNISGIPFTTCGQLESALILVIEDGLDTCSSFQSFSSYCDCPVAENACEMCPHGEIAFPNKPVTFLEDVGFTLPDKLATFFGDSGSFEPPCWIIEAITRSYSSNTDECQLAQWTSGYCGCPPIENACTWCAGGKSIPESYHDVRIPQAFFERAGAEEITSLDCRTAETILSQITASDETVCYYARVRADICGCYEGGFGYLGTPEKPHRRKILEWIPRVVGAFSLVAVTLIAIDVLRDKKKRNNPYCLLMIGMSCFDFCYSLAWIASTAPIPYDIALPIEGAAGNEATCKAQCFFFQLGLGSIFYTVMLTTYYYMVIVQSKREPWIKKQQWWLHGIPIVLGLALAGASIPHAFNVFYGCHVATYPRWPNRLLLVFPVAFVLCYCTPVMIYIWWHVRKQSRKSKKWRQKGSGGGVLGKLESQVMWQAIFYLSAFWFTWPLFLLGVAKPSILSGPGGYAFAVVCFLLAPMQGLLNGLIYFRPRLTKMIETRRKSNQRRRDQSSEEPKSGLSASWSSKKSTIRFYAQHVGRNMRSLLGSSVKLDGDGNDMNEAAEDPSVALAALDPRCAKTSVMMSEALGDLGSQNDVVKYEESMIAAN